MKRKPIYDVLFVVFAGIAASVVMVSCAPSGATLKGTEQLVDPLMGDWQGHRVTSDGLVLPLIAQIVPLGGQRYQASVQRSFDSRDPQRMSFDFQLDGERLLISDRPDWKAMVSDGNIHGTTTVDEARSFQLHHVVRSSPNAGAEPPDRAIVLFDGTGLNKWQLAGETPGVVSLARLLGGNNCAGYIKTEFVASQAREAVLEIGSDDGVKAWLNGKLVHAKNVARGLTPGEDKVDVQLNEGKNALLLKITQGGGGWGACVRLADPAGKALPGVSPKTRDGFVTQWSVSGPFSKPGMTGEMLFDEPFPPENPQADRSVWNSVNLEDRSDRPKWKLVDGAMEVIPGAGSLITTQAFTNFQMHLEFRTPFMPEARGQARGNSGVYLQGRYEIQVLDSYGLTGEDNECGGIYKVAAPRVNMCAPPGQWQTYDISFRAPRFESGSKKIRNAIVTVMHNGRLIHENLEIPGPTGSALDEAVENPGPIMLQDHGDKVQYRNVWILETRH